MLDMGRNYFENRMAREDSTGPYRGLERMELSMHGLMGNWHYPLWFRQNFPDEVGGFVAMLDASGGGETGAPELKYNPVPREHYHTDWVADRTIRVSDSLSDGEDWFVWMSFPDPHHPWDPPAARPVASSGATSTCRRVIRARARRSRKSLRRSRVIGSIGTRADSATTKADPPHSFSVN